MAKKRAAKYTIVVLLLLVLLLGAALTWIIIIKKPFDDEDSSVAETIFSKKDEVKENALTSWQDSYIYWAQERPGKEQPTHPIQRMSGDGTGQTQAFTSVSTLDSAESVAISPDGETLAYACRSAVYELCLKKADGTGLDVVEMDGVPHQFSWSHDGQKIIMSILVGSEGDSTNEDQNIIATVNADGSNYQEIMKSEDLPGGSFHPSYFPQDGKILFYVDTKDSTRDIYTVESDGSGISAVLTGENMEYEPALTPTGDKIAYTMTKDGREQIWLADTSGENKKQLTSIGDNKSSSFSPDGKKIAFISKRDGSSTWEVYLMNTDGSEQIRLTNNKVNDLSPRWSEHKIGGLGIDFSKHLEVLSLYVVARMNGDSSTVKEVVAKGLQEGAKEVTSSLADEFDRYEIIREANISQSEKKVDVKLFYKAKDKDSQERTYTLNLYQDEKWLVSAEDIKVDEKESDQAETGEIKTGSVTHDRDDLETKQEAASAGSESWRLDPFLVATKDGADLGFNQAQDVFTLVSQIESGEYSGAGEATVEAKHGNSVYIIQLFQPVDQGDEGIWVINSVTKK